MVPARPQGVETFRSEDEGYRFYIQGAAGQTTATGRQRRASSSALVRSGHFAEVMSFRGSIGRTSSDGSAVRRCENGRSSVREPSTFQRKGCVTAH